jgi:hypothetical protein
MDVIYGCDGSYWFTIKCILNVVLEEGTNILLDKYAMLILFYNLAI